MLVKNDQFSEHFDAKNSKFKAYSFHQVAFL